MFGLLTLHFWIMHMNRLCFGLMPTRKESHGPGRSTEISARSVRSVIDR